MNVSVIGTGYVGLTTGTCLAEVGNNVICVDIDYTKIDKLNQGVCPIYEPGLTELISRNMYLKRLLFTTDIRYGIDNSDIVFCAVGTPPDEDYKVDLKFIRQVAISFGRHIDDYKVFVLKSTVPVGTADMCKEIIQKELDKREKDIKFDVVTNPEFLKQGAAVKDTMTPDRIIVGVESDRAKEMMENLYKPFVRTGKPIIFTDIKTPEIIKYAANSFLATKISFINEIANFCELCGGNVKEVAKGIGLDDRIGSRFLHAGIGYGGSCLKKDTQALIQKGKEFGYDFKILNATEQANEFQKDLLFMKLMNNFNGNIKGKTVALWGVSFKPKTDDTRDAPSINLVNLLRKHDVTVHLFDPVAADGFKERFFKDDDTVIVKDTCYEAAEGADAIMLVTEWDEFRGVDLKNVKERMKGKLLLDGRNVFLPEEVKEFGFDYSGIGLG